MQENTVSKVALSAKDTLYKPVADTLAERGRRYGSLKHQGELAQGIKTLVRLHRDGNNQLGWVKLTASQKEALDNIATKISRIINGDPDYLDNWHDIAGYATLVENELKGA